jgi:pilus assembly protein Flp/PilA
MFYPNLMQLNRNSETITKVLFKGDIGILLLVGTVTMRRQMSKAIIAFLKDQSGATAIEYGLIAAGISVVIIAAVNNIGSTLNAKFDYIANQLK